MAAEIRVLGAPELDAALSGLGRDLHDLTPLNQEIAGDLAKAVAAAAPRVSGRLAASFRPTGTSDAATVESDLIYAPVIEYGWGEHNIEPAHFAESALAESSSGAEAKYRAGVEKLVRKAQA